MTDHTNSTPDVQVTLGFTGSRYVPNPDKILTLERRLLNLGQFAPGFVTGACTGLDALIGRFCVERWPQRMHMVIIPGDRKQIDPWWLDFGGWLINVIQMPPNTTYADRNQAIVDQSQQLVGFPIGPEDHPAQRRSGTWQTIRMGRRCHTRPPVIIPLDTL